MIIGLTGRNASGKGEVARRLQDGGFRYLSLSDEIRAELKARGLEPSRENMIDEGRRLRKTFGEGVLARRCLRRVTPFENYVVDSIRNPAEVEVLRLLKNFYLVRVDAPVELRYERLKKRARPGDSQTFEQFKQDEERELASDDPAAQQLIATGEMADFVIVNDADIETLKQKVVATFQQASLRTYRPGWDEYFMRIASMVALRSNCVKRRTAAVVVKDRRIISTGYNGTPKGVTNCYEGGCPRCYNLTPSGTDLGECRCSHAEENSIVQAAYHGVSLKGATMYTIFSPCLLCSKMIINAGIKEVVYLSEYPMASASRRLLEEAGVVLRAMHLPDSSIIDLWVG